jgi:uncharacterized protein with GYD domain
MPTYITLAKWTQQGIQNIKESPERLDAFKKFVEATGGQVKDFYMVMGKYDMVLVIEAPEDAAVAKNALATSSKGSVVTETFRAFTEEEYRKIVSELP